MGETRKDVQQEIYENDIGVPEGLYKLSVVVNGAGLSGASVVETNCFYTAPFDFNLTQITYNAGTAYLGTKTFSVGGIEVELSNTANTFVESFGTPIVVSTGQEIIMNLYVSHGNLSSSQLVISQLEMLIEVTS